MWFVEKLGPTRPGAPPAQASAPRAKPGAPAPQSARPAAPAPQAKASRAAVSPPPDPKTKKKGWF